jgi:hypothetical protein
MDFHTYWVAANWDTNLHEGTSNKSRDLCRLKSQQPLLAISDEDSDEWLRVYDPSHGMQGYVDWSHLVVIDNPPGADSNPTVKRLASWAPDWPTVIAANRWIRSVTWGLFVAFGLLAAWKTTDFHRFLLWGTAFFLASQLLVFTKIWPWYVIWPLAFGALKPASSGARLALLLSAGLILEYALIDYCNTRFDWAYAYRSIPAVVLPVVLFGILKWWQSSRNPVAQTGD